MVDLFEWFRKSFLLKTSTCISITSVFTSQFLQPEINFFSRISMISRVTGYQSQLLNWEKSGKNQRCGNFAVYHYYINCAYPLYMKVSNFMRTIIPHCTRCLVHESTSWWEVWRFRFQLCAKKGALFRKFFFVILRIKVRQLLLRGAIWWPKNDYF